MDKVTEICRVLIPVDGTQKPDDFLRYLPGLVAGKNTEVILLRVLPDLIGCKSSETERIVRNARAYLLQFVESLSNINLQDGSQLITPIDARIVMGDPAEEILKYSIIQPSSLVVMSTHGRTGLERVLEGSVTEKVLRRLGCAMFSVHRDSRPSPPKNGDHPFRRILVPLDGTTQAMRILPQVEELARTQDSELILFRDNVGVTEPDTQPAESDLNDWLEKERARMAGAGLKVTLDNSRFSDPRKEILYMIEDLQIDLVAMTTHGRKGLWRFIDGSVTEFVLRRATCPFLLMCTAERLSTVPVEKYLG